MSHALQSPRAVDHLVLPVAQLDRARQRLTQLGFTVAADADHPFGTRNACVFFADDTYLEPLAVGSREDCLEAARTGNVFVARHLAYQFRRGEGLSAMVVKTSDAEADHARFVAEGLSGGEMLGFSRQFRLPDGRAAEAAFKLAFAADLRSPDFFAFSCERVNPLPVDRGALQEHANAAAGLSRIVLAEHNPSDFQYLLEAVLDQRDVTAHSFGLSIETANATVDVLTPEGLAAHYGLEARPAERGLLGSVVVVGSRDLGVTAGCLAANGIAYQTIGARLVVVPQPGQGVAYAFEESK
jgi:hypothetical protein